ncbi:ArnT family glycosyltransferase [Streptacidiphilus jiangxiensis]|uniref:Dolichyl-phosphate-mannose-protein mannosyltransferase n=1 Tax=Streptacidiphilus jiangxiensis TaxID=235985 RepID=A0A1H7V1E3_STRJI|nr:glycosyltransferase family 39 protein [Streptacidiphilus jiangxiensis]SEM02954.1 Dolichyl-phosphate-mannose-protein mannosyltransferase [Streptacidiphilus jiangxiensis]
MDQEFYDVQTYRSVPAQGPGPGTPDGTTPEEFYWFGGDDAEAPQQLGYEVYEHFAPAPVPEFDPAFDPAFAPEPEYEIPEVPETGWSVAGGRRRSWIGRMLLLSVLVVQAMLSLRLHNTAFQDEALYLFAGHQELDHLLHGTPLPIDYSGYFSGSPWLYPVLGAAADSVFGLTGARLLSLLFMLGATVLLYALSRRLFNERVALCAAAFFTVLQSTITLGFFATYDAPAIFLLALSAWIVVRTNRATPLAVLLAAPVAALAVAVKYAAGLYLPTLVLLAVLVGWPYRGRAQALVRGLLLALGTGGLLGAAMVFGHMTAGLQTTTTSRVQGTDSAAKLLSESAQWGGLMFAVACGGALAYIVRERMHEAVDVTAVRSTRRWRAALALLLCGTALLAPAYQIHLHTSTSLHKHIGFGLLFAAPMAGIGITRLMGAHFRQPQLGILVWVVMLALGLSQSTARFTSWPDSTQMVQVLGRHTSPTGRYLAETREVPVYYLHGATKANQWTSTYGTGYSYRDAHGRVYQGADGYRHAVADGWFDLILLDGKSTPAMDAVIRQAITTDGTYRLIASLPFTTSQGPGTYQIYSKP